MMLDRKTKNIDASEELLEDRKKLERIYGTGMGILSIVFLIVLFTPFLLMTGFNQEVLSKSLIKYPSIWYMVILGLFPILFGAVFSFIVCLQSGNKEQFYDLLIYLKRQEKKKK